MLITVSITERNKGKEKKGKERKGQERKGKEKKGKGKKERKKTRSSTSVFMRSIHIQIFILFQMQYLEFTCRVRQHILHPTCGDYYW
jgi:hydroxymethylglutaryl-CoA reductase